ncbi:MAG: Npt1/Npt2 family nucleotide transporter [Balneolaceae bacterium]
MKQLINKFYDVRPGEWYVTIAMFFINFFLMVVLYFLKPARDSLFLVELGAAQLPLVFILVAVISIPVTQIVSKLVQSYNNFRVFLWTNFIVILNLLIIRGLFWIDQDWVYTLFYIWVSVYSILIISQYWVFANELYNTSQSKRLFSLLNLGAILGAIAGSQFSSVVVKVFDLPTENLLYLSIGVIFIVMAMIYSLKGRSKFESEDDHGFENPGAGTRQVFKGIIRSRYQFLVAAIIGVAMLISTLVDYQLKAVAADTFPDKTDLTAFMGTFYAGLSLASLFIQILFSGRILRRMGVGGGLLTRPVGLFIASVLMMFEPVLAVAVFLGGFDGATQYSIDKTSREILFLPFSQRMKERIKFFMDVFVDRFFRGIAGFILLGLVFIADFSVQQIAYVVTAFILVWIGLAWRARKEYVEQFRDSISKRYLDIGGKGLDLNEPETVEIIKKGLESKNTNKIHYVLKLLEGHNVDVFAEKLIELLEHESNEIRLQALRLLKSIPGKDYTKNIIWLLDENDTELRLESIHYICMHTDGDPEKILMNYLKSDSVDYKAAALGCISKHGGDEDHKMISDDMIESIINQKHKNVNLARAQVAQVLKYIRGDKARKYLPVLLNDPSPAVRKEAILSMGEVKDEAFIPLLIQNLNDKHHALETRRALANYGQKYINLISSYYHSGDFSREICRIIPKVLAEMKWQQSVDKLLEMLQVETKPEQRLYLLKSLNKLRGSGKKFRFNEEKIREQIYYELNNYYTFVFIYYQLPDRKQFGLLKKALHERLDQIKEHIFRLLGLIYNPKDMYGAYLGLQSINEENRATSIEFLDNVLDREFHEELIPVVDPVSITDTVERAKKYFGIKIESYTDGMLLLLNGDDDWLKTCAMYGITSQCPEALKEYVVNSVKDKNPVIKETAQLVADRF